MNVELLCIHGKPDVHSIMPLQMPLFNILPEYMLTVKSWVIHPLKCFKPAKKNRAGVTFNCYFLPFFLLFDSSSIIKIILESVINCE